MRAVKSKRTKPENRLATMLARMGLKGWRRNVDLIVGKPDVAFVNAHIAIFVDGCFWHGCPYCSRKLPETNREYWQRKIERNIALAKSYNRQLRHNGWSVIRIWEHEMADQKRIKSRILRALHVREGLGE